MNRNKVKRFALINELNKAKIDFYKIGGVSNSFDIYLTRGLNFISAPIITNNLKSIFIDEENVILNIEIKEG